MKSKNVNLDIIRIFAAFIVLSAHIGQHVGFDFGVGAKGVQLFFVLSGYLIFVSLSKGEELVPFYKKRLFRILPTYYICLLLGWITELLLAVRTMRVEDVFSGFCGWGFFRYVFCLQCFIPSKDWGVFNNHNGLWTMSCFIGFYLVAPFLYKVLNKFYRVVIFAGVLLVVTPYIINGIKMYFVNYPVEAHIEYFAALNPLTCLYCFMLGATLYVAVEQKQSGTLGILIIIVLVITQFQYYAYECVFVLFVMVAVSCAPIFINPRICRVISYVSNGSFALYLIHPIFLQIEREIRCLETLKQANKSIYTLMIYIICIVLTYFIHYGCIVKVENAILKKLKK